MKRLALFEAPSRLRSLRATVYARPWDTCTRRSAIIRYVQDSSGGEFASRPDERSADRPVGAGREPVDSRRHRASASDDVATPAEGGQARKRAHPLDPQYFTSQP